MNFLHLNITKYAPLTNHTYLCQSGYRIGKLDNTNNKCFMYSVLSCLHSVEKHLQRPSKYNDHLNELNFDGINFPVTIENIPKFEKLNKINI